MSTTNISTAYAGETVDDRQRSMSTTNISTALDLCFA